MPRVDLPISGFAQAPSDQVGQPRITRLVNCKSENGKIVKTPGTKSIPLTTVPSGEIGRPLAFGVSPSGASFCVGHRSDSDYLGLDVWTADDTASGLVWRSPGLSNSLTALRSRIEYDECPRVEPIFTDRGAHYQSPGIIPGGDSTEIIVVAECLEGWNAHGSFVDSSIEWAKFSTQSMTVTKRGKISRSSASANNYSHLTVNGKVFAFYSASNQLSVYKWDSVTQAPVAVLASPVTSGLARTSTNAGIALACDSAANRATLIDPLSSFWHIDIATGTILHSGTLSIPSLTPGTIGAGLTTQNSTLYVCYRVSGTEWVCSTYSIDDEFCSTVVSTTSVCVTDTMTNNPYFMHQAAVTPWYGASVSSNTAGAMVTVWWNTNQGPGMMGTVRGIETSGSVISQLVAGFDMFAAMPASAAFVHDYSFLDPPTRVSATIWGYTNDAIPCAVRLGQSERNYYAVIDGVAAYRDKSLPRMIANVFRGGETPSAPNSHWYVGPIHHSVTVTLAQLENGLMRNGMATAILRQKASVTGSACDVFLITQADGASTFSNAANIPDILQQANTRDVVTLASSIPGQYSTVGEDQGFHSPPVYVSAVTAGAGANPPAGTYTFVAVREWIDGSGALHRSPVSNPVTLVHSGGSITVGAYVSPWQYLYGRERIAFYRTTNGGTTFHRINPGPGSAPPAVGFFNDTSPYTDAATDATISANEILYTQAERSGLSGMLETWGAPGCSCVWAGQERTICGGLENRNRVRWSNLYYPGEGISWPEHPAFWVDLDEDVTAVACLDGIWIAFSRNSIWAITGQGPDAFGQGSFDTPRKLTSGQGCYSWRSVVEAPVGLFFQGIDRQIYLLQRGSLAIVLVSTPIRSAISQLAEDHSSRAALVRARSTDVFELTSNWIRSSVYYAEKREVWFAEFDSRVAWVLSLDDNQWRSEVDQQNSAGHLLIGGGSIRLKVFRYGWGAFMTITVPAFVRTNSASSVGSIERYRVASAAETSAYLDSAGFIRYMGFWTSNIQIPNGRIRRVWVDASRDATTSADPHTIKADMFFWFDGHDAAYDPESTMSVASNTVLDNGLRTLTLEFCPARQKCNEFAFAFIDNPNESSQLSWHVTGIALDVEGNLFKQTRQTGARGE